MSNVTTSNWHAWIKKLPAKPIDFISLHVLGDVDTHSEDYAFLMKNIPQGFNPAILLLDLKVEPGFVAAKNPQIVPYHELLKKDNQYTSIEIFFEGEKIKEINKISHVI